MVDRTGKTKEDENLSMQTPQIPWGKPFTLPGLRVVTVASVAEKLQTWLDTDVGMTALVLSPTEVKVLLPALRASAGIRYCCVCGYTESDPCDEGCGWADGNLCTVCADDPDDAEGSSP
jgi:hypothetical protein